MIEKLIVELDYNDLELVNHLSDIGVRWRSLDKLRWKPRFSENQYKCYFEFKSYGYNTMLTTKENFIYLNSKYALLFFKECKSEYDINLILTTFIDIINPISDKLIIDYNENHK